MKKYTVGNAHQELGAAATKRNSAHMLPVTDWLSDLPENTRLTDLIEVQFKNTRKGYFHNSQNLPLEKGVKVVVEANPGYDVGEVVLTGKLVELQIKKNNIDTSRYEIRQVLRIATDADLERAKEAHAREQETMIKARQLAKSLGLEMKIGDVEYQGDGSKAIFFYIADGRVDFRQLIKVLADVFKIRIEMKQIGARQEAGRIGGIGPCGRPLCCASWMTNFVSVSTSAARYQDISLNPQKLAGQCAKLKCCLNYEVDTYAESMKRMPSKDIALETADATYYHFKTDIFKKQITYSTDKSMPVNLVTIDVRRAFEVIEMNKAGEKPSQLDGKASERQAAKSGFNDVIGQDSLTRFDKKKRKKNKQKAFQDNMTQAESESDSDAVPTADSPADESQAKPGFVPRQQFRRHDGQFKRKNFRRDNRQNFRDRKQGQNSNPESAE
jgi:Uncharacterized homolog of PSP1